MIREAEDGGIQLAQEENRRAIILYQENWHRGVVGIVASKILDKYRKPAIVFAAKEDRLQGSARATKGIHLSHLLAELHDAHPELIERFGGHALAAGLTIRKEQFDTFRDTFETLLAEKAIETGKPKEREIDAILAPTELPPAFCNEFSLFEPFGIGNPNLTFAFLLHRDYESRTLKAKHIHLTLRPPGGPPVQMIGFNQAESFPKEPPMAIAYRPRLNTFQGITKFQPQIVEILAPEDLTLPCQPHETIDRKSEKITTDWR